MAFFNDLKNKALNIGLNIADSFTPILKESKFRETGVLTPEEFVAAGDFLTGHCPTWQWAPVPTSKSHIKDYLPRDKQFLMTKNVPCSKRCRHLMDSIKDNQEEIIEEETGDGGWVDTHHNVTGKDLLGMNQAAHDIDTETNVNKNTINDNIKKKNSQNEDENDEDDEDDDDGEAVDMDEDFDHNIEDEDESTVVTTKPSASTTTQPKKIGLNSFYKL
jgi:ubiquitin-like-conjugating enzyme ATG3